ncbi:helix-turn-helix transcriptional regulator [Microbacterium sp. No. 7]|uniref:helix-turn-helix transcriptional regulator n=1 Tax=Microbacterium sp. No. 7 TaxID=1714373 RepID=UPI0006ED081F|nr:LuxR C-terminal-related transcriptional regulator [Microbacterium sp. No. 7]ALJ22297.1 hypothetical protein AOA12_21380 [Microbacterium sp. No. 7]
MPGHADVNRPNDRALLRALLRRLAEHSPINVLMAGLVETGSFTITELVGTSTDSLDHLFVRLGEGVGGRAVAHGRPTRVPDYISEPSISHQHDEAVRREGLRAMAAVPVQVDGVPRAVLYAATRSDASLGDGVADDLLRGSRMIGAELRVRDEVDRRVALLRGTEPAAAEGDHDAREAIRVAYGELVALARATDDEDLSARILQIGSQLMGTPAAHAPALSPRESDVLSQVALGCTYPEVARRLSLQPGTVKSYMQTIMVKLGAHSRHEAVATARRLHLLP